VACKFTKAQLEEAYQYWRENNRNCLKTSGKMGCNDSTIANYRDKYHWVSRADAEDEAELAEAKKMAVAEKAKILKNAFKINKRIGDYVKIGPVKIQSPGGELEKVCKVVQLLTGDATERFDFKGWWRTLPGSAKQAVIDDLEQSDG